jgi:HPt (histidine-containing phosphotransfer) domain-containing protein
MKKALLPLLSTFVEEPAIAEILPIFLQNLPSYLRRIEDAIAVGDLDVAARTCHDLKGAAGGYGYPSISALASTIEVSMRVGDFGGKVKEQLELLRELCQRAAKGLESLG